MHLIRECIFKLYIKHTGIFNNTREVPREAVWIAEYFLHFSCVLTERVKKAWTHFDISIIIVKSPIRCEMTLQGKQINGLSRFNSHKITLRSFLISLEKKIVILRLLYLIFSLLLLLIVFFSSCENEVEEVRAYIYFSSRLRWVFNFQANVHWRLI